MNDLQTYLHLGFDLAAGLALLGALWLIVDPRPVLASWFGVAYRSHDLATVSKLAVFPVLRGGWIGAALACVGLVGLVLNNATSARVGPWFLCFALGALAVATQLALRFYLPRLPNAPFESRLVWEAGDAVSLHMTTTRFAFSLDRRLRAMKLKNEFVSAIQLLGGPEGLDNSKVSALRVGSPWLLRKRFSQHAESELAAAFPAWTLTKAEESVEPLTRCIIKVAMSLKFTKRARFRGLFEQSERKLGQQIATALEMADMFEREKLDLATPYPVWIVKRNPAHSIVRDEPATLR